MNEEVQLDIHANSIAQSKSQRRALVQELNRQLPDNVKATPDERDGDKIYNLTTAMLTSVGTVAVSNPDLVLQTIRVINETDKLSVNNITGLADTPLIKIDIGEVNLDLITFNIDSRTQIDDSTVVIKTDSPKEAEKIREQIEQERD